MLTKSSQKKQLVLTSLGKNEVSEGMHLVDSESQANHSKTAG